MPNASIAFVDTNVLLYAASGRPEDAPKTTRARQLLKENAVAISFQVLQEFYANAINPRKLNLTPAEAAKWCATWMQFPVASLSAETFVRTLELAHRFQISNWDAARWIAWNACRQSAKRHARLLARFFIEAHQRPSAFKKSPAVAVPAESRWTNAA